MTRFYEISDGAVLIDGVDIREIDKNDLRGQLGMVLQDAHVFSGTIRENIRFGRLDATDREVEEAAKLANADGFIARLSHGYDTMLGAEGGSLSHGQRQLLTIARAILADPAILILDEATSSVDTRTEMHIQQAMKTLMQGRTSFVIAHRLSTIQDATASSSSKTGGLRSKAAMRSCLNCRAFTSSCITASSGGRFRATVAFFAIHRLHPFNTNFICIMEPPAFAGCFYVFAIEDCFGLKFMGLA